jgi:predicted permease
MDLQVILTQMAVLFILMAIGYIAGKAKMLTRDGNKILSRLVLFIALPCTVLSSVFENELEVTVGDTVTYLLFVLLAYAIAFLISIPVIHFTCKNKSDRGILNFMSVFSNCGFMGFPVVLAIFGISSAYYVALFNIPYNLLVFSLGIFLIAGGRKKSEEITDGSPDGEKSKGGFSFKFLLNPVLLSIFLSIPLAITGVQPPLIISDVLRITGSITTPGAMLVIGSTLSFVPLKTIFREWQIIPVTLLKLIIIPLVTWLVLRQIITNELMLGVLVVLSGMPTAAMASMLAIEYNGNEQIASAGIFVTTLLCGITVPMIVYLLLM